MRNIIFLIFWYTIIQNNNKYCNLRYSKLKKSLLVISQPVIIYVRIVYDLFT